MANVPVTVVTLPDVDVWSVRRNKIWRRLVDGRGARCDLLQLRPDIAEIFLKLSHRHVHCGPLDCDVLDDRLEGDERWLHLRDHRLHLRDRGSHPIQCLLD